MNPIPYKKRNNNRIKRYVPLNNNSKLLRQWFIFKFYMSSDYYAVCPTCNYSYRCNKQNGLVYVHEIVEADGEFTQIKDLYNFCPLCGQKFSKKYFIDYTDIKLPALLGWNSLVEMIKDYNKYENIENLELRKQAIDTEYWKQWTEIYGKETN